MSHELRTPLNSLLILSKLLADNGQGNLSDKQVEFARNIHDAGTDLLALINEILDLAKIESGTMEVDVRNVPFAGLKEYVERNFGPVALQKGLKFDVELAPELPASLFTDPQRLQQVIRNLLSNAFKFTEEGSVLLRAAVASRGWNPDNDLLNKAESVIAFSISDTGIGIPDDKHRVIFEAFQQADGTTSRKYGGTGLGLSISREIASVLHGEIAVVSTPGQGSTFTLFLPRDYPYAAGTGQPPAYDAEQVFRSDRPEGRLAPSAGAIARLADSGSGSGRGHGSADANGNGENATGKASGSTDQVPANPFSTPSIAAAADDRSGIYPGDLVLLAIDDDANFRNIVAERARGAGFKVVTASEGESGLALARDLKPSAILLDIRLPGMNGWAVLDRLKHDPAVRHIPVHVLTVGDEGVHCALKQGARRFVQKTGDGAVIDELLADIRTFVTRTHRNLLIVEDDENQANSIVELIGDDDVSTTIARSGEEAIDALRAGHVDCVVLDLGLPGMTGFEFVDAVRKDPALAGTPIVIYTARDLTRAEQAQLQDAAEAIIIKDARSPERLLEETVLFLHRVENQLPPTKRKMLEQARLNDPALRGARVLIVDDDVRNVFALTAALEQRFGMRVTYADNGAEGIRALETAEHVDVILMDVMMPGMDGYETIRRIRQLPARGDVPIIALTAKAMKGDREKCLAAGASDYIAKPVDTDQLASLIRVWIGERKCDPEQAPTP
jgi:CheY-like chemotaxis protein